MSVARRDLFKIFGAGLATQAVQAESRTLAPGQYDTLERMLDILLPTDEISPGARDAGVARYIDMTLKYADEKLRSVWISGLEAMKGESTVARMTQLAANEEHPETELERFFVLFKRTAIDAYYLSEAGRKSLGYHGDTAMHHFTGCTHAEHKPT